jgi:predicted TIM-barrel fold metal-dependent hydrolase
MTSRRDFLGTILAGAATVLAPPLAASAATSDKGASAPPQTIDWHNHWLSPTTVELLSKRTTGPRIEKDDGRLAFVTEGPNGIGRLVLAPEFTNVDARLKHLDRAGVDRQVISWPTTLGVDAALAAPDARDLWTAYNDELADLVHKYPTRFSGLAALPTSDIDWAASELDRAHTKLGLIGAVLPVGAFQTLEGARHLTPIFDVAQKYGSHIYLHTGPASSSIPGQSIEVPAANDAPVVRASLDRALSFARGTVTLTQTGYLDKYPDVSVQVAMLGGSVSILSAWLTRYGRNNGQGGDAPALLKRVYFDTGVFGRSSDLVDFAVRTFGADRFLFGSDYPLAPTQRTVTSINSSDVDAPGRHEIYVQNGHNLFQKLSAGKTV